MKMKTKIVKQNLNPIWNEVFDIPIFEGNRNVLHVELLDSDKVKSYNFNTYKRYRSQ